MMTNNQLKMEAKNIYVENREMFIEMLLAELCRKNIPYVYIKKEHELHYNNHIYRLLNERETLMFTGESLRKEKIADYYLRPIPDSIDTLGLGYTTRLDEELDSYSTVQMRNVVHHVFQEATGFTLEVSEEPKYILKRK